MKRVLQVVTCMNSGGLENMIMNYYREIDKNKIQFDFFVHRKTPGFFDEEIKSLGGNIYYNNRVNPFSPFYRHKIKKFLKNKNYDTIHVHLDTLSGVFLKCAKSVKIKQRIVHSHSSSLKTSRFKLLKSFLKRNIDEYSTYNIGCSNEAGSWLFKKEYLVLNNAIDTMKYSYDKDVREQVRDDFGLNDNLVIGHVGNFLEVKNHTFLLDVFFEIYKKNINSKLVLVGKGVLEKDIRMKVSKLNLEKNVIILNSCNDVSKILNGIDIFVFPSLYEGLPLSVVEAQTSGLPCFCSNTISKDVKLTDHLEFICLEKNPQEWADKILKKSANFERVCTRQVIINSGYDICKNTEILTSIYNK